jgi:hypothetical protein
VSVPEDFRAKVANRQFGPPLEQVRRFVHFNFSDADGLDEVRADLARQAAVNPDPLLRALGAIEAVLGDPPPEGELARLVAWDGNWVLDDPSDAGAACWLREVAELVRGVLAEAPPGSAAP